MKNKISVAVVDKRNVVLWSDKNLPLSISSNLHRNLHFIIKKPQLWHLSFLLHIKLFYWLDFELMIKIKRLTQCSFCVCVQAWTVVILNADRDGEGRALAPSHRVTKSNQSRLTQIETLKLIWNVRSIQAGPNYWTPPNLARFAPYFYFMEIMHSEHD